MLVGPARREDLIDAGARMSLGKGRAHLVVGADKEKAPNNLRRSGLTLNEATSLQATAKFLPGLLFRYTLLRGFPWGLAFTRHRANATWIW